MEIKACLVCAYYAAGIDKCFRDGKHVPPQGNDYGCERFLLRVGEAGQWAAEGGMTAWGIE